MFTVKRILQQQANNNIKLWFLSYKTTAYEAVALEGNKTLLCLFFLFICLLEEDATCTKKKCWEKDLSNRSPDNKMGENWCCNLIYSSAFTQVQCVSLNNKTQFG